MHLKSLAFAAALVLACVAPVATAAQTSTASRKVSIGFLRTADTFWTGSMPLAPCVRSRPRLRRLLVSDVTPRVLTATQERHGELVGELLAPPPLVAAATAAARRCATAATQATGAPALLADGLRGWSRFHAAFAACLVKQHAEAYVGGMTLWVDNRCNW